MAIAIIQTPKKWIEILNKKLTESRTRGRHNDGCRCSVDWWRRWRQHNRCWKGDCRGIGYTTSSCHWWGGRGARSWRRTAPLHRNAHQSTLQLAEVNGDCSGCKRRRWRGEELKTSSTTERWYLLPPWVLELQTSIVVSKSNKQLVKKSIQNH